MRNSPRQGRCIPVQPEKHPSGFRLLFRRSPVRHFALSIEAEIFSALCIFPAFLSPELTGTVTQIKLLFQAAGKTAV